MADHFQQTTAGMVILAMFLEMTGQAVDACGQERDLNFRRSGITLGALKIGNDLCFGCVVESHLRLLLSCSFVRKRRIISTREQEFKVSRAIL